MLKREALRVVGLVSAPALAMPGQTYGDMAQGTARRATFSAHVEHASVLYSQDSLREALAWLDRAFGRERAAAPDLDDRGPWILLLVAAVVLLARPLSTVLPRVAMPPIGAGLAWRRLWLPLLIPMVMTPLLLRVLPTHFLPVLVGDYLAVHFALYGLMTALCLARMRRGGPRGERRPPAPIAFTAGTVGRGGLWLRGPGLAHRPFRDVLRAGSGAGRAGGRDAGRHARLLCRRRVDDAGAGCGARRLSRLEARLPGLAGAGRGARRPAVALLVIIVPVVGLCFVIYGLFSAWVYRRTGNPLVAGIANAVAFAWAIGVTFPLLAG